MKYLPSFGAEATLSRGVAAFVPYLDGACFRFQFSVKNASTAAADSPGQRMIIFFNAANSGVDMCGSKMVDDEQSQRLTISLVERCIARSGSKEGADKRCLWNYYVVQ